MIPIDQTLFGAGEGNCYSAALASITELALERFARFHELYSIWGRLVEAGEKVSWEIRTAPYIELASLGWGTSYAHGAVEPFVPRGYSIANGPAARGVDHSCVALDGVIVHDPHPDRTGLLDIQDFEVVVPLIWPASQIRMARSEGPHAPA
jgi:hypothetical protein